MKTTAKMLASILCLSLLLSGRGPKAEADSSEAPKSPDITDAAAPDSVYPTAADLPFSESGVRRVERDGS